MKKLLKEFKEFITRGNVIDLAVGIIIGSAFTAIITAVVSNILTPLINWIPGSDGTGALQVVLREAVTDESGATVTEALIIDFGAVISAIITFFLTAVVLFIIVKAINTARKKNEKLKAELAKRRAKEDTAQEAAAAPAQEAAPVQPAAPAVTSEQLLAEIRDLLKAQSAEKPQGEEQEVSAEEKE